MAELIGFNARTGRPVQAAAGSLGSYADLSTDFYKTFQPDNWQHAGSQGWSSAPVPGWGNNPNLQMFARRAMDGLGCPPCNIAGASGCVPCEPGQNIPECQGCFEKQGYFQKHNIGPAVVTGVITAIAIGLTMQFMNRKK